MPTKRRHATSSPSTGSTPFGITLSGADCYDGVILMATLDIAPGVEPSQGSQSAE